MEAIIHLDGRRFTLETDHPSLEYLLSARLTNKRLIRWALQLQGLDFVIRHRSGAKNANADGLSRQAWFFSERDLQFQGPGVQSIIQAPEKKPRAASVLPVGDVGRPEARTLIVHSILVSPTLDPLRRPFLRLPIILFSN